MKKIVFFALFISILLFNAGCDSGGRNGTSTVSAIKDGRPWSGEDNLYARDRTFDESIGFISTIGDYSEQCIPVLCERLSVVIDLYTPDLNTKYFLPGSRVNSRLALYSLDDGDQTEGLYRLEESVDSTSWILFTSVTPERMEGQFQLTLYLDSTQSGSPGQFPPQVRFMNGRFNIPAGLGTR